MTLLTYPTVIEHKHNNYHGFLTIHEKDCTIAFKQTEDCKIVVCYKKSAELLPFRNEIDDFTNNNTYEFLKKLEQFLKTQIGTVAKNESIRRNYRAVINDYAEFCKFYFNIRGSFISSDLSQVKLCYTDESNRQFTINISINYSKSSFTYEIVETSIPCFEIMEGCSSLVNIYNSFSNLIESPHMQTFFTILDEIDANCWILDPETLGYKENYRRIVLETNTSALLNISEMNARDLPEIKIFGSQLKIEYFTDKIAENLVSWEPENNIIEELLKLFDISAFPTKPLQDCDEDCLLSEGECCICFALKLEDVLPEVVCSNTSCNQIFHQKCLYQWLSTINAGSSVYEIYGPCPNCEKDMHCPVIK